ncbi:MAG: PQQ-like beta-propeller repeat protein, partial [Anaerolineae bacterium]|nr:PQQ-like beta-propeller repeat protein [Anaerolineae bacterium]
LLLSSCVPLPLDPRWASVALVDDGQKILFAFHDHVTLIDPVDGSLVELRDSEGRVRVDSETGNALTWQVQVQANPATVFYYQPITIDENTLLLPSFSRHFYEVDLDAARLLNPEGRLIDADTATSQIVANVLATDDTLYIPLSEGDVTAINRQDFSERWKFDTEFGVWAEPLLVDDVLYVTSLDHYLYALYADTGELRWKLDLGGAIASTPVYLDGYLYVGSFGRKLFKVADDGTIAAEYEAKNWIWGSPTIADGILYVGDSSGWVYALDISGSGMQLVWEQQVAERAIRATPVVADDKLIVASRDHRAYWLSRDTGSEIFRRELVGEVLADMMVIEPSDSVNIPEPYLLISTMATEEALVAFTLESGERRWAYRH